MPKLADRLRLLKPHRLAAADVLAVALDHADASEAAALSRAAVSSRAPVAYASVIRNLHRLDQSVVAEIVAGGESEAWHRAIRNVARRARVKVSSNIIRVIDARCDPLLAAELPPMLLGRAQLAEQAAVTLVRLTKRVVGPTGRRRAEDGAHDSIDAAIAEALEDYRRHRRGEILAAAALLTERPGRQLSRLMEREDDPGVRAVRSVTERVDDPLVRANIIRWLGNPALARSAARWLHRFDSPPALSMVLSQGHLLLAPKRRSALQRAERPIHCVPRRDLAAKLAPEAQAQLPRLICRLGLSARARVRHLAELRELPSPVARTRIVAALLTENGPRVTEAINQACVDPSPAVAGLAVRHVLQDEEVSDDQLAAIERGPHPALADRARRRLAERSIEHFRAHRSGLRDVDRRAAVVRLRAMRPAALREELHRALEEGDTQARVDAMMTARRVGLVAGLEEALIELADHDDPATASTALAALGAGRTPRRLSVLMAALRHDDARARANAVESLDRAIRSGSDNRNIIEVIAPLAEGDHNRPRANAIRAMMRLDAARARKPLQDMLVDPNPMHRVSAIWVSRHAPASEVAGTLERLADHDSRATVRVRAKAALRCVDRRERTPAWVTEPATERMA